MSILTLILVLMVSVTNETRRVWASTTERIDAFREARTAFEAITQRLSQATLNTYWDYDDYNSPTRYLRQSELRFTSGPTTAQNIPGAGAHPTHGIFFQAPLGYVDNTDYKGLDGLLNTWGYYLEYGDDADFRPSFLGTLAGIEPRKRIRLMQFMEPSESLRIYAETSGNPGYKGNEWYTKPLENHPEYAHVLAENIVALVILPKLADRDVTSGDPAVSLTDDYDYDTAPANWPPADPQPLTQHQLPPMVRVTMVAIDKNSANRLEELSNGNTVGMLGLDGTLFTNPSQLTSGDLSSPEDLETLLNTLGGLGLTYRVFTSDVSLRSAKWSKE